MTETRRTSGALFRKAQSGIYAALLVAILAAFAVNLLRDPDNTMDDAYMFVRYADHVIEGHGLAWNPDGVATYGSTSMLYQMLITVLRAVPPFLDSAVLLAGTSGICALVALGVLTQTAVRFSRLKVGGAAYPTWALLLILVLMLPGQFRFHATTGMDTMLSFLCNAVLVYSTLEFIAGRLSLVFLVFAAYLAFAARPDNLIYATLFAPLCMALLGERHRWRSAIWFLIGLGVALAADTVVKMIVFGDPLPLPFYAKQSGYYEGYLGSLRWNSMGLALEFLSMSLPFLIGIVLTLSRHTVRYAVAFLVPVVLSMGFYFTIVQIMGDEARYYYPSLPFVIVCSLLMLGRHLGHRIPAELDQGTQMRWLGVTLLTALASSSLLRASAVDVFTQRFAPQPMRYVSEVVYRTAAQQPLPELGWSSSIRGIARMASLLPAGSRIALSEYGYIGALVPELHIVDPLGLHDPFFAHNGFAVEVFLAREPDLIWLPHPDYSRILCEVESSADFWARYDFYPGAYDYGLAVRRDGLHHEEIVQVVTASWLEDYGGRAMADYAAQLASSPHSLGPCVPAENGP